MVRGREARTFWTLSAAHLINDSYVFFLPTLLPILIPRLDLPLTWAALAVAVYQVTSSFTQPIFGHLADRHPLRWLSFVGLAGTAIGAGGIGLAPNYWTLLGCMIVAGLGTAAFHPVATATVSDLARKGRGRAMSLYITAGNIGLAVGPAALGLGLPAWGPLVTVPLALPCLGIALAVYLTVPARAVRPRGHGSLGSILAKRRVVLGQLLGIATIRSWANAGLTTFLPLLLVERGRTVEDGATALAVILLFGGIGGLVGGYLSDRIGRDVIIAGSLLVSPLCAWPMLHGPGAWLWIGAALVGFFLNGAVVALTVRGQELMPESVAMVSGLMLGFTVGMGGLAVTPLAALAEVVGLGTVADLSAVLPFFAGLLALTLRAPGKPELSEGAAAAPEA